MESDIKELNKKLTYNSKDKSATWNNVGTVLNTGITMKDMFDCGDAQVRKDLLNSLCWNLNIRDGQIASVQYKMPWKVFEKVAKSQDMASWLSIRV